MKVAMYYNNHDVRIEEMPKPQIGPDEFLLKVKASGICGSDVLEWYRLKRAPLVLGHEVTGEIFEIGSAVKKYKPGDRVFVSHHVPCFKCRYCLNKDYTVCETLHTTNFYPGGFCEYIRVPAMNVERGTFILPPEVTFAAGSFIEPLACCLRGQNMIGLKEGRTVLILGAGISGLLHLLIARYSGAERIVVTDISDYRLKVAKNLGADSTVFAKDGAEGFRLANNARGFDAVIVCTGATSAFKQALECVDRAGTILCFAATEPGVTLPVPVNDFWRQSIKIIHSYGNGPDDALCAIELLRKSAIDVEKLITHRLPLTQAGLGFKLVAEAKECIKVILEP